MPGCRPSRRGRRGRTESRHPTPSRSRSHQRSIPVMSSGTRSRASSVFSTAIGIDGDLEVDDGELVAGKKSVSTRTVFYLLPATYGSSLNL